MRMDVHGMKRLVLVQLKTVTWKSSSMHTRRVVLGMKRLVVSQLKEVTWRC